MFRPGRGRRDQPESSGANGPDQAVTAAPSPAAVQTALPPNGSAAECGDTQASPVLPAATPATAAPEHAPEGAGPANGAQPAGAAGQSGAAQLAGAAGPATAAGIAPATAPSTVGAPGRLQRTPPWAGHLTLLACYLAAGIAVTWPRLTYIADLKLPASPDVSSYIWALWWVPHQLVHLANPWFTTSMAAPVGTQLGFNTLMPLPAVLLAPITYTLGPIASFSLLTLVTPGLACYAMYRAARLWLNIPGAVAAGALFGLSSMLDWQNWYHVNLSLGTVFLPLTLEACIRLRRGPTLRRGFGLGLALAGSILVNQESTVLAIMLTIVILVPWLARLAIKDRAALRGTVVPLGGGTLLAAVIASPQLIAMGQQAFSGGASVPAGLLARNSTLYGVGLPTLFSPSPRLASYGLARLTTAYNYGWPPTNGLTHPQLAEGLPTFGIVLTVLAVLGLAAAWRQRSTWGLTGLWLGSAAVALGPFLAIGSHDYYPLRSHVHWSLIAAVNTPHLPKVPAHWAPVPVSNLMPFSWLMRIPGLSGLREADRFALLGLVGAAVLAGLAVQWLTKHARFAVAVPVLVVVAAAATLEAGWPGTTGLPGSQGTMRTAMPRVTGPISRDHSDSIVVDVPFGLRGGLNLTGSGIAKAALLLATQDGHPRAVSYTSWVPKPTINGILRHPFYAALILSEAGLGGAGEPTCAAKHARLLRKPDLKLGACISAAELRAARADALRMHVGWVIVWKIWKSHHPGLRYNNVYQYLDATGFKLVRQPKGIWLYRMEAR